MHSPLTSYRLNTTRRDEFWFHFSMDFPVEVLTERTPFLKRVASGEPYLFYIRGRMLSTIEPEIQAKLKVVYAIGEFLIVTNQLNLIPIFDTK